MDLQIEGLEIPRHTTKKRKRGQKQKQFRAQWVKLPWRWTKALRQSKRASTYQLALTILFEAFKREQSGFGGGEIVLSATMTGMPRSTRKRAIRELIELKLIKVKQNGNGAFRVSSLLNLIKE